MTPWFKKAQHGQTTRIASNYHRATMIPTFALSIILAFIPSHISAATLPTPPTSMDQILGLTELTVSSGILGGILIVAGLLMCFTGKKYFKLFLSVIGLAAGALFGLIVMVYINDLAFKIPNHVVVTYIVAGVFGLLAAIACLHMWKLGVFAGAGLGGYSLVAYILSLKVGGIIANQIGRQTALLIGAGLGVVAAIFLEDIAVVIASSIAGALSTMCGVDCYLNTGFRAQIYDQAIKRSFVLPELSSHMYYMFAATLGLAVLGIVLQLITPSKGFGRAH